MVMMGSPCVVATDGVFCFSASNALCPFISLMIMSCSYVSFSGHRTFVSWVICVLLSV